MKKPVLLRRVIGKSMAPKLRPGQLIVATTIVRRLKPGQVVILQKNDKQLIKRIERIEDGKLFVIGDNPDASTDSRHFGWLEKRYVIARVIRPNLAK